MGLILLIFLIAIIFLFVALINANAEYKTLKLEWEKMNYDMDVLSSNYNKAKKEISDLQDRNDELVIHYNDEIQELKANYEKKLLQKKSIIKTLDNNYNDLVLKEAQYLTSLEEVSMREANYLNIIADLEKTISEAAAKKERAKARAKKKKEEKNEEQLEITFNYCVTEEEMKKNANENITNKPGEGEIKCEKKRRRKKGDSK